MKLRFFKITISFFLLMFLSILPAEAETVDELIKQGRDLCVEDKYEEGIECYDKAIEKAPDYFYTWVYKGYAQELTGDKAGANASYNRAFSINPIEAYIWYTKLGDYYKKGKEATGLGKHKEGSEFFDGIFLMSPFEAYSNYKKVEKLYNEALSFFNMGQYESALKNVDEALKLEPANVILQELKKQCEDALNL